MIGVGRLRKTGKGIIRDILKAIKKDLIERFGDNLVCLILYGSWAKGTARKDSDIDLLCVFNKVDKDTRKALHEIEKDFNYENSITIAPTSLEEFQKEKIPLYTAVKREGIIISGNVDLKLNAEPPHIKYAEYFKKSKEFETKKVEMAEDILREHPSYCTADLCFVAAKHAIQMALAMKGAGYSSKLVVLLPLAEEYLGKEIADAFRKLFTLYIKSEYLMEFLTEEEAKQAIDYARKVLTVYEFPFNIE